MSAKTTAELVAAMRDLADCETDHEAADRLEAYANTWDEMVWVTVNTHGVIGLRSDGSTMHWREVFDLYVTSARDLP